MEKVDEHMEQQNVLIGKVDKNMEQQNGVFSFRRKISCIFFVIIPVSKKMKKRLFLFPRKSEM
jgi:hypothetical protein